LLKKIRATFQTIDHHLYFALRFVSLVASSFFSLRLRFCGSLRGVNDNLRDSELRSATLIAAVGILKIGDVL